MGKRRGRTPRAEFKKNHQVRARHDDYTRQFHESSGQGLDDLSQSERISGKGELTRHRTVTTSIASSSEEIAEQAVASLNYLRGRVVSVHGLTSQVRTDDGALFRCATRRVLKNLNTDDRHVIAVGDRVWLRPEFGDEGFIERIDPRTGGVLSRASKGRRHIIAANVDWMLIVVSVAEPMLKPHLIDRFLLTAEQFQIRPLICLNKIDLIDPATVQRLIGSYAQIGYRSLLCSTVSGRGIPHLQALLANKQTVVAGQSGVGKSSLLNAIEPGLGLRIGHVSTSNQKGRHTTTNATLIPLGCGGFVVDTPGIRQFQLWDITAAEVASLMPDFRPHVSRCRYPDCLHLSENGCAIKDAVADGRIDPRRYDGYCHLIEEELAAEN